jgi:AcrR family transcriptional regulator
LRHNEGMSRARANIADMRGRILDAAVDQLRRHGPAKTGVVDVARALGVSHAAVYRYFDNKDALFDAVAERWLASVSEPLNDIVARRGKASKRLEDWLTTLIAIKQRKVNDDREMFAAYSAIAEAARKVVSGHVQMLLTQLQAIIADGMASGEFNVKDAKVSAAAVLDATSRFHHPYFVKDYPADAPAARRVIRLLLAGLASGPE